MQFALKLFQAFFSLLLFACGLLNAQPYLTDSSINIKPKFELDDVISYYVTEKYLISDLITIGKAELNFKVSFTVVDTIKNYTISYLVQTTKTSNKNLTMESVKAAIMNGLKLTYKLNKEGWVIDLPDYQNARSYLINALDTIIANDNFNTIDYKTLMILRKKLKEDDGLEICLAPFLLFNTIFTQQEFRKQKDYSPGSVKNIFYEPRITGVIISQLKTADKLKNIARVNLDFVGNKDSAAKYMAPFYKDIYTIIKGHAPSYIPEEMKYNQQSEYEIQINSGYPQKISYTLLQYYLEKTTI